MAKVTLDQTAPWPWMPWRDTNFRCRPDADELQLIRELFPDMNPRNCRWHEVQAYLIAKGHMPGELSDVAVPGLLEILKRYSPEVKTADDSEGLRQVDVARGFGLKPYEVKRLIDRGVLLTNGKSGRDCRINPQSVLDYSARTGIAWGEDATTG